MSGLTRGTFGNSGPGGPWPSSDCEPAPELDHLAADIPAADLESEQANAEDDPR